MEVHRQTALGTEPKTGTISALLDVGQATNVALAGVNRPPLTYSALRKHVQQTVASLNARGIGRNDRVAIVLPNGPELASAFIGIAAGATAAPLNAAYRDFDFQFYLSDLGAKALVVQRNCESPAVAVAKALRIPILQLVWNKKIPQVCFQSLEIMSDQPRRMDSPARTIPLSCCIPLAPPPAPRWCRCHRAT
jgi:acyl-CoA synthetase (AMP-forming)/AMP-acid ligase II